MKTTEQFEDWWKSVYEDSYDKSNVSSMIMKAVAWTAWQASRAAIEIKLDDKVMVEDEFDKGHNCAIDYCAEAIRSAGIKVKE